MSQGEGGGPRPHITPEICAAIVADIANEIPYEYAAEANGISERTLYYWLDKGREHRECGTQSIYSKLLQDIKRAERDRISEHRENINAGREMWTCDAWMLERRWWKHYSKSAPILDFEARLKKMEESKGIEDGEANSGETEE